MTHSPVLNIHGLHKSYLRQGAHFPILRGINLEIPEPCLTALMGPSGGGKSTLLHLIAGLDRPDTGEIWVGGKNLSGFSKRQLASYRQRRVAILFQFFNLFSGLNVWENLSLPALIRRELDKATRLKAGELLEQFGLGQLRQAYVHELSGGEKQRLALCRALLGEPQLLLADEPTGSLDHAHGQELMKYLKEVVAKKHLSVLYVTHDPELRAFADRSVHIQDGKIEAAPELV